MSTRPAVRETYSRSFLCGQRKKADVDQVWGHFQNWRKKDFGPKLDQVWPNIFCLSEMIKCQSVQFCTFLVSYRIHQFKTNLKVPLLQEIFTNLSKLQIISSCQDAAAYIKKKFQLVWIPEPKNPSLPFPDFRFYFSLVIIELILIELMLIVSTWLWYGCRH